VAANVLALAATFCFDFNDINIDTKIFLATLLLATIASLLVVTINCHCYGLLASDY
jgi:hypothetical protein